ncbi:MAG: hypothetical protein QNK89_10505 [Lacinutrix sp.]|uniref:hypothetical protein n=1 Tax=Lacinutrix sp. TaxID=1937692 RepID=UPI0030A206CC
MKIKFKKKRFYANLILGIVFTSLGIFSLFENDNLRWSSYGNLFIGILYLIYLLFEFKHQYLIIKNNTIQKNILYGLKNKINLNDIIWIRKFAGDYTLNTELIEKQSLIELNTFLDTLNLPSKKRQVVNKKQ